MPTTTQNTISVERVTDLIEAYGSNTQCWPEQERLEAIACLESSVLLQKLMHDAKQLDDALLVSHVEEPVDEALLAQIVDQLPEQPVASQVFTKSDSRYQWAGAMAAVFVGVAIMFTVMSDFESAPPPEQLALQDMDYWLWQEVTGQVSSDDAEEAPTDFMSML